MIDPLPINNHDRIKLGHGSGGRLSAELLQELFLPAFRNDILDRLEDQAVVRIGSSASNAESGVKLAFTTDSFVVRPLFFPGGDIGRLAVFGTVNDLAVGGAVPLFLSAAFILEEGLPIADLQRIVRSMREACDQARVSLVTGDTKVVDRGNADLVFITTSGIGWIPEGRSLSISSARPGDRILVSGTIGDHGFAVLSVREGLEFETSLQSDAAPLADLTRAMLEACPSVRCMRDPTRGGLSSALHELAAASKVGVELDESLIPIRPEVRAASATLGLDPLYVANEGKVLAIVSADDVAPVLAAMRAHPLGEKAMVIGSVTDDHPGFVLMKTRIGGTRVVDMLSGEQLPRIC